MAAAMSRPATAASNVKYRVRGWINWASRASASETTISPPGVLLIEALSES